MKQKPINLKKIKTIAVISCIVYVIVVILRWYFAMKLNYAETFNMKDLFFWSLTHIIGCFVRRFFLTIEVILFIILILVYIDEAIEEREMKQDIGKSKEKKAKKLKIGRKAKKLKNRKKSKKGKKVDNTYRSWQSILDEPIPNPYKRSNHNVEIKQNMAKKVIEKFCEIFLQKKVMISLILLFFMSALIYPTGRFEKYKMNDVKIRPYKMLYYEFKDIIDGTEQVKISDYEFYDHYYSDMGTGRRHHYDYHHQIYIIYQYVGKKYETPDISEFYLVDRRRFKIGKENEINVKVYKNTGIIAEIDEPYVEQDETYHVKLQYAINKLGMPYKLICNDSGGITIQKNENYDEEDYKRYQFNIYYYQCVLKYDGKILKNINLNDGSYTNLTFDKDGVYEICVYGVYDDIISNTVKYVIKDNVIAEVIEQ